MSIRRPVLAVLAAVCLGLPVGAAPAFAAVDTQGPKVLDLQITPSAVSLTGMGTKVVTIKVHLTDQTGVSTEFMCDPGTAGCESGHDSPYLALSPALTLSRWVDVLTGLEDLTLASGTVRDGWWATTRVVTGMWAGTREVVRVKAADTVGNETDVDPRPVGLARQLAVTATDPPRISAGYDPATWPPLGSSGASPFTIKGRAYLSTSLTPLPSQTIWYCTLRDCAAGSELRWPFLESGSVVTNASGYYALADQTGPGTDSFGLLLPGPCLFLGDYGPWKTTPVYAQRIAEHPPYRYRLTAAVATTPVPLGTAVPVYGHSDTWGGDPSVYLQRQLSPNVWRAESSARVRESGRFTLIARPLTRGNHRYRVLRPASTGDELATTVTPTMLLGAY